MKKTLCVTLGLASSLGLVALTRTPVVAEDWECPSPYPKHVVDGVAVCDSEVYKSEGSGRSMRCYYKGQVCDEDTEFWWSDIAFYLD